MVSLPCIPSVTLPHKQQFSRKFQASIKWQLFSKHRPSRPMLSKIQMSVRLCVCPSVCSLLRYRLKVFLPPLPKVGCPIFLEIRNPWGKIMERSGLRFEFFLLSKICLKSPNNKRVFFGWFCLYQNIWVFGFLGATIRIGQEMLCLLYAGLL